MEISSIMPNIMMTFDEDLMAISDMITDDYYHFEQTDLAVNCFHILNKLRQQNKLCYVTIKVDNKEFLAHRVVLSATIPYFHAMFTYDMMESKQTLIEIQDSIDCCALESVLQFAYSGHNHNHL